MQKNNNTEHKQKVQRYFENWKKVTRSQNLSAVEYRVLKNIEIYRNTRSGYAWPSVSTQAKDIGMSISTVQRAVIKLTKLGLLEVDRNRGKVNKYRLTRTLCYPLLHEIEANYGHTRPYFEDQTEDSVHPASSQDNSKVTNEPNYGHRRPPTKVMGDRLTYSKELIPITNTNMLYATDSEKSECRDDGKKELLTPSTINKQIAEEDNAPVSPWDTTRKEFDPKLGGRNVYWETLDMFRSAPVSLSATQIKDLEWMAKCLKNQTGYEVTREALLAIFPDLIGQKDEYYSPKWAPHDGNWYKWVYKIVSDALEGESPDWHTVLKDDLVNAIKDE